MNLPGTNTRCRTLKTPRIEKKSIEGHYRQNSSSNDGTVLLPYRNVHVSVFSLIYWKTLQNLNCVIRLILLTTLKR